MPMSSVLSLFHPQRNRIKTPLPFFKVRIRSRQNLTWFNWLQLFCIKVYRAYPTPQASMTGYTQFRVTNRMDRLGIRTIRMAYRTRHHREQVLVVTCDSRSISASYITSAIVWFFYPAKLILLYLTNRHQPIFYNLRFWDKIRSTMLWHNPIGYPKPFMGWIQEPFTQDELPIKVY